MRRFAVLITLFIFAVVLWGMASPAAGQQPTATTVPLNPGGVGDESADTSLVTPFPVNQASAPGFQYGIEVFLPGQDTDTVVEHLDELGVMWVKHTINWANVEGTRGNVDFDRLDAIVEPLDEAGLNILLTVTNAPNWSRSTDAENGPPIQNSEYARFVGQLAERYSGRVDAYEIWTEPNLRREWSGKSLGGEHYVALLRLAYNAIKENDPSASVISAGLAPTQTNDGTNAIDDRIFLQQMYDAGVADFVDAIGVHPNGWANPPDSVCCRNNRPSVANWDDQEAFFFLETLTAYREIMNANGDSGNFLWATSFGWGAVETEEEVVNPSFGWIIYTNQQEQSQYTVRAFQLGRDLSYVGPMFLDNLNACGALGGGRLACSQSLLDGDGNPRPVFDALADATP